MAAKAIKAVDRFVASKRQAVPKPTGLKSADFMVRLLKQLYKVLYNHTDTFERSHIGADTAYLMGAIISDNACVWPKERPLVKLLEKHFPEDHAIWEYIGFE